MRRVLAVDPGVATGWAQRLPNLAAPGHREISSGIIDDQLEFCDFAYDWAWGAVPGDVIVCESYVITASTGKYTFQPASLEIIGVLRWVAHRNDLLFVLQAPAKKRFMPDSKLRSLGWWVRGSEGHDNDALRHLGVYLAERERNEEVLRAV